MKSVSIIGGGIIGQFCAYFLTKSGHQVTIYDDRPGMPNASHGNCGLITPSHILPMNSWSVIWQGMKWLGKKDAPLSIKPRLNRRFIGWFLDFTRHANQTKIQKSSDYRHAFLQLTWQLYEDFFKNENPDLEFYKRGLIYVCQSEKSLTHLRHEHDTLVSYGLPSKLLRETEIAELEPSVKSNLGGAMFECDGWLDPIRLNKSLEKINVANGVNYEVAIKDLGALSDEIIVLAAGARSAQLAEKIGISLHLIPGKGYNLTTSTPLPDQPSRPVYMFDHKVVFTPWKNGFRLGSTMEFCGYDLSLNAARLEALKLATNEYLDLDLSECDFTPWAGWRPMTSDCLPIVQRSQKHPNLILATGHGMLGLTLAPATGYLVDCLANDQDHTLHSNYRY